MLTHVSGYDVTTDSIRSKTVKDSYVRINAGFLFDSFTTINNTLTVDNSHDSYLLKNSDSDITVIILDSVNNFSSDGVSSIRRIFVTCDSIESLSNRTLTFVIPDDFISVGNRDLEKTLCHGSIQVFIVDIVNNVVSIHEDIGSHFDLDEDGNLIPLSDRSLYPRNNGNKTIGGESKRWLSGYFNSLDVANNFCRSPINSLQRNTNYSLGDIVTCSELNSRLYLECSTSGMSGSSLPSLSGVSAGDSVTDGEAVWSVKTLVLSNSEANGIAIGRNSVASIYNMIAIGNGASANNGGDGIAIGVGASGSGGQPIAIGKNSNAVNGSDMVAIGSGATAGGGSSIAIGKNASAVSGSDMVVIGTEASSVNGPSVVLGKGSISNSGSRDSVVLGINSTSSSTAQTTTIGTGAATSSGTNLVAIGTGATASNGTDLVAIGTGATVNSGPSIAIGKNATAISGSDMIAIGTNAKASYGSNIAIGSNTDASALDSLVNSVALGTDSVVYESDTLSLGKDEVGIVGEEGYKPEYTRKIQHVTDGVANSDAVTIRQLNGMLVSPTFTGTPTAPTASYGTNNTQIATTEFVQGAVSGLVDSAPQTLDTLNELAEALGDDPNFATTIATQIGGKADAIHTHSTADVSTLTSYSKPNATSALATSDTLNEALGKLEKALDGKQASGTYLTNTANGYHTIAVGDSVISDADCEEAVAIGYDSTIGDNSDYSVVIGSDNTSLNQHQIVIGGSLSVQAYSDIVIGTDALTSYEGDDGRSEKNIAIGVDSQIVSLDAVIDNSVAIGSSAKVSTNDTYVNHAVALGADSTATESDTLSIGKDASGNTAEYKRRIVHVADGTADSDAVTVGQLNGLLVSPTFTGTPIAPTATAGTNNTQIATTAFVQNAVSSTVGGISTGVQSVVTGSSDGTISVDGSDVAVKGLKSAAYTESNDYAPTSHNQASNTINAMTGYVKASSVTAIGTTDTLNQAIGKLEKALDGLNGKVETSLVGNQASKIPQYSSEGHLVLPSGIEIW